MKGGYLEMSAATEGKNATVAVLLSFLLAGLGQFYVGQIGKGFMFVILDVIAWSLNATIVGLVFGIPMYTVIWIWSMIAAYKAIKG